ncbi:MAG: hypothetical protein K8R69_08505 [Deltaproteobacteria bacterium]|nr:hypothetical protein [Deltaproteobacteria bacterium]
METTANSSDLSDLPALQSLLSRILPDARGALSRRADFFASSKEAGLLETPEADPLQSCTQLNVSTGSIYFGDVRVNSSVTQYFRISNPNCCAVNYTISGGGYGFSLSTSGGTIPANGSVSVAVTFTPYVAQNYSGSVSISPSGSGVSFTGRGVP